MRKKVGFLGGAFNPITLGHIEVAKFALNLVHEVVFVPCNNHPWGKSLIAYGHRSYMCKLAMRTGMLVGDFEKHWDLPGDTFSLITRIKEDSIYKFDDLFFIIGMDEANEIQKWKNIKQLAQLVKFIVLPRQGVKMLKRTENFFEAPHIIIPDTVSLPQISSTEIRAHLENYHNTGNSSRFLQDNLNPAVLNYIKSHGHLYGAPGDLLDGEELLKKIPLS